MCKVWGICNILWTMAFQIWCKRSLSILSYCYSQRTFLTFFRYMKEPQTSFIQTHTAVTYIRLRIKCKCPVSDRWLLSQSTSIRQAINKNDWAVCLFFREKINHFILRPLSVCTRFNRSILYILDLVFYFILNHLCSLREAAVQSSLCKVLKLFFFWLPFSSHLPAPFTLFLSLFLSLLLSFSLSHESVGAELAAETCGWSHAEQRLGSRAAQQQWRSNSALWRQRWAAQPHSTLQSCTIFSIRRMLRLTEKL